MVPTRIFYKFGHRITRFGHFHCHTCRKTAIGVIWLQDRQSIGNWRIETARLKSYHSTIRISTNMHRTTFTLASIPSSVSNLKLVIQASAPQSGGISNAFAKACL